MVKDSGNTNKTKNIDPREAKLPEDPFKDGEDLDPELHQLLKEAYGYIYDFYQDLPSKERSNFFGEKLVELAINVLRTYYLVCHEPLHTDRYLADAYAHVAHNTRGFRNNVLMAFLSYSYYFSKKELEYLNQAVSIYAKAIEMAEEKEKKLRKNNVVSTK